MGFSPRDMFWLLEGESRALKRASVVAFIVQAKARTYLTSNSNSNSNDNGKGKSKGEQQIPCGDDNKKDKGNCVPSPSF